MIDKDEIKELFTFTKGESRGVFILLLLIVVLVLIRFLVPSFTKPDIPKIEVNIFENPESAHINKQEYKTESKKNLHLFDPNSADYKELIEIGFSKAAASNLVKYRKKGGIINERKDLLKIYGVDTLFIKKIAPYIIINKTEPAESVSYYQVQKNPILVELNSSGAERLKTIKGIGDVLSKRIVRYRELLGGYYEINQLKEVYGISDSLYTSICEFVKIDTVAIKKININTLNETELALHPYISKYEARSIIKYREYIGKISSLNELKINYLLSDPKFRKVKPYLAL